jgi:hypothetical protein
MKLLNTFLIGGEGLIMSMKLKQQKLSNDDISHLENMNNLFKQINGEDAIFHNNTSPFEQVQMTDHAYQRAVERFNMAEDNKKHILNYFKSILKDARLIGEVICEKGNKSILYANRRIAIYLSPDLKKIYTVNKFESVTYEPIKNIVSEILAKEIRKLTRVENARVKKLELIKVESEVDIAELRCRAFKTKSPSVKVACKARIKAIEEYIDELENEIQLMQITKRSMARSMVAVV